MMSYESIAHEADRAERKARRNRTEPVSFFGLGTDAIMRGARTIPFGGGYVPRGFKRVRAADYGLRDTGAGDEYLEVDSSGFGGRGELAMTLEEFAEFAVAHQEVHFSIIEAGQFQVVLGLYLKTAHKILLDIIAPEKGAA